MYSIYRIIIYKGHHTLKIGLISDIHGNLEALEAILEYLSTKIYRIIVLGDIVGYMTNPNKCVQLMETQVLFIGHTHVLRKSHLKKPIIQE